MPFVYPKEGGNSFPLALERRRLSRTGSVSPLLKEFAAYNKPKGGLAHHWNFSFHTPTALGRSVIKNPDALLVAHHQPDFLTHQRVGQPDLQGYRTLSRRGNRSGLGLGLWLAD